MSPVSPAPLLVGTPARSSNPAVTQMSATTTLQIVSRAPDGRPRPGPGTFSRETVTVALSRSPSSPCSDPDPRARGKYRRVSQRMHPHATCADAPERVFRRSAGSLRTHATGRRGRGGAGGGGREVRESHTDKLGRDAHSRSRDLAAPLRVRLRLPAPPCQHLLSLRSSAHILGYDGALLHEEQRAATEGIPASRAKGSPPDGIP